MQNTILINKLQAVIDNHSYNFNASEAIQNIISELKNEILSATFKGSKKKAQMMLKSFTKNDKRPALRYNFKADDGYYYATDSYMMVKSSNQLLELLPDDLTYADVKTVMSGDFRQIEIDKNVFNRAMAEYKLDKKSVAGDVIVNKDGISLGIQNKYLTFIYNLLDNDFKCWFNGKYMFKFTDDKNEIIVMAVRKFPKAAEEE